MVNKPLLRLYLSWGTLHGGRLTGHYVYLWVSGGGSIYPNVSERSGNICWKGQESYLVNSWKTIGSC